MITAERDHGFILAPHASSHLSELSAEGRAISPPARSSRGCPRSEGALGRCLTKRLHSLKSSFHDAFGRPGGSSEAAAPDPIPNSAVKRLSAHDTSSQDAGKSVAARSAKRITLSPHSSPKRRHGEYRGGRFGVQTTPPIHPGKAPSRLHPRRSQPEPQTRRTPVAQKVGPKTEQSQVLPLRLQHHVEIQPLARDRNIRNSNGFT